MSQQILAAMLGVRRPSLNKILKDFERRGLIDLSYRAITIHDSAPGRPGAGRNPYLTPTRQRGDRHATPGLVVRNRCWNRGRPLRGSGHRGGPSRSGHRAPSPRPRPAHRRHRRTPRGRVRHPGHPLPGSADPRHGGKDPHPGARRRHGARRAPHPHRQRAGRDHGGNRPVHPPATRRLPTGPRPRTRGHRAVPAHRRPTQHPTGIPRPPRHRPVVDRHLVGPRGRATLATSRRRHVGSCESRSRTERPPALTILGRSVPRHPDHRASTGSPAFTAGHQRSRCDPGVAGWVPPGPREWRSPPLCHGAVALPAARSRTASSKARISTGSSAVRQG
ncbi:MAG TPA: helix-turn-helix domain-containing protein [Pseudonocardiaceae bacterium]